MTGFTPKVCDKNCGSYVNGKHLSNAVGGSATQKGQGSGSNKKDRYKIPSQLLTQLFKNLL